MKYLRLKNMFDCENVVLLFSDELSLNKLLDCLHLRPEYVESAGRFQFETNKYGNVVFKADMGPTDVDMPEFSEDDSNYLNMLFESTYSGNPKFVQIDDIEGVEDQYIIFNKGVVHKDLTDRMLKHRSSVKSAGFVSFDINDANQYTLKLFGESVSLNVKSNPENSKEATIQFDPNKVASN